jgi:hypothetical protein
MQKAVSSRLATARLKWFRKGQRRYGGSRETFDILFLTIVSAYAPTARAPPSVMRLSSMQNYKTI